MYPDPGSPTAWTDHYAPFGRGEERAPDMFDEERHLRKQANLRAAFDDTAGDPETQRCIQFGFAEGCTNDPAPGAAPSSLDFMV